MLEALRDAVLFALAYLVAALLGRALSADDAYFINLWPPSGVYLAVLACTPARRWPAFIVGGVTANLVFDAILQSQPLPMALGFAFANTAEAVFGGALIQLILGGDLRLNRLQHLLAWTVAAGLVAPMMGATTGASVVSTLGPANAFMDLWMRWWLADVGGVMVFGPLTWWLLRRGAAVFDEAASPRALEAGLMAVIIAGMSQLVFSGTLAGMFAFVLMPFFLWPAIRFGIAGVSAMAVLLAAIAITNTLDGLGPFSGPSVSQPESVMLAQIFCAVYAFTFHVLAAIFDQSKQAERALRIANVELEDRVKARTAELEAATQSLREQRDHLKQVSDDLRASEERFRVAQELSLFGFTIMRSVRDANGKIVDFEWQYVNPAAARMLQRPATELVGRRLLEVLPGNRDSSGLFEAYTKVVETGRSHDAELYYDAEGIRGWFRNMTVRLGDGVAVSFTDVSHRRLLEDTLRQRNEALMEADRRKDEFLATLAHELRNPLAPIRNAVEILRRAGSDPVALASVRELMERQVAQMARLIDDLLDLSRISHNRLQLRRDTVALRDVVESAIETSRPLMDERRHELTVELPDTPVWLHADLTRLAQVLVNLLNNSAKYTEPGGRIRLSARCEQSEVLISVEDNGIGIPADMLPRVFDMFTQADRTLDHSRGGLGIGLTLVRRLVEMHAGKIEVRSVRGQGTTFIIRLPVLSAPARAQRRRVVEPRAPGTSRQRVLIVDDNEDSALSLATLLDLSGNETRIAHDGLQAIAMADSTRPDVVLLDIGLPGRSGYEVARHIRAQPWGKSALLIAITGWGQDDDRRRSEEAGFDAHLVKPIDPVALERLLLNRERPAA
jgi:signal transduction histidine kinase/integral membrane sensor domain MASE1